MRNLLLLSFCLVLTACKTNFVNLTIVNNGNADLHNVELQYPNASFGKSTLAPGESYSYKAKIIADGELKLKFLDPSGREHNEKGPPISKNATGQVTITIDETADNKWNAQIEGR